jgi:O-antigen ligase
MNITALLTKLTGKNLISYLLLSIIAIGIGVLTILMPESSKWLLFTFVLVGLGILSLKSPFHTFLIFIITLPLEATLVLEVGFTIRASYIVLLSLLSGMLMRSLSSRKIGNFITPLDIPIFGYIAITALSLLFATLFYPPPAVSLAEVMEYRGSELRGIIQLFLLIFFSLTYFLTVYFCSDKERLFITLRLYIGIAFILSLYGIYQFLAIYHKLPFVDITNAISTGGGHIGVLHSNNPAYFRPHGTFQEPLNFGHYLLSVIPFLLALYLHQQKKERKKDIYSGVPLVAVLIMVMVLILTKSRGTWLGFLGSLILLIFFINARQRLKVFGILVFIGVVLGVFASFYLPEGYNKLPIIFTQRFFEIDLATDPRIAYIVYIIRLVRKHPVLGVGIGNYGFYAASYFGRDLIVSAHGLFSRILVETGILGFVCFGTLLTVYCTTLIKLLKQTIHTYWYPYLIGYLAGFTGLMIQYLFFGDRLNMYVWFFMGISMATVKLIKQETG